LLLGFGLIENGALIGIQLKDLCLSEPYIFLFAFLFAYLL
jgi:hypothetical protein